MAAEPSNMQLWRCCHVMLHSTDFPQWQNSQHSRATDDAQEVRAPIAQLLGKKFANIYLPYLSLSPIADWLPIS